MGVSAQLSEQGSVHVGRVEGLVFARSGRHRDRKAVARDKGSAAGSDGEGKTARLEGHTSRAVTDLRTRGVRHNEVRRIVEFDGVNADLGGIAGRG